MKKNIFRLVVLLSISATLLAYSYSKQSFVHIFNSIIDSTPIGATTPASIQGTAINATSNYSLNGLPILGLYPRTCNSNGCFIITSDGTIFEWGSVSVFPSRGPYNTAFFSFPQTFTTTPIVTVTTVGYAGNGDATTPPAVELQSLNTSGASAYMARVIVAGAGGGNFDNTLTLNWTATGY